MWFRRTLVLLALAVTAASSASAQLYGALTKLPWNRYVATRIADGYTTIIGRPGTNTFGGSATAGGATLFSFPAPGNFPIAFSYLGTNYAAGSTVPKVCAAGYITFAASPSGSTSVSVATGGPTKLVAPYWSDVQPNQVSEGGVFWRVDGTVGSRILTVEWRVQGIGVPAGNPGQFQAKLFEGSNKIEYFYGANPIVRNYGNPSQGAFVGLKDLGYSGTSDATQSDATKMLLVTNPDLVRDTVAVTRTRAFLATTTWYPEGYATWPISVPGGPIAEGTLGRPSRFFHYTFPTLNGTRIGYRFTPVDNDVAADSVGLAPGRPGNAYAQGASITVIAKFLNLGVNSRLDVPVQLDVYRLGNPTILTSRIDTAFRTLTPQLGSSIVTFAPSLGGIATANYGTYVVKVYSKLDSPLDQDRANDTATIYYYISYPHDVMAWDIMNPVTYSPSFPQIYPVGYPVAVEGRFLNIGLTQENNVPVGYAVYDQNCNLVYSDNSGLVRGTWDPLEFRDVTFSGWTPTAPGTYYIRIYTLMSSPYPDEQRTNDTFPTVGCGKEFTVRFEIDVEALSGVLGGSPLPNIIPGADYPDGRPVDIIVPFRNNGFTDATNVPATVQIRNSANTIVYNRNSTIPYVPGDGSTIFHAFPKFVPGSSGTYCLTAWATDAQDPLRGNDTIRWCFDVKPRLCGTIRVGLGERFRTVQDAADSVMKYGVSCPVTFELVDDAFTVRPRNNDPSLPAYDFRGDIIGSSATNVITWRAVEGKDSVRIILKSPSGIGMWFGQGGRLGDTANPTGYMVWDGGTQRKLRFILDTAGSIPPTKAIPFLFSSGSSNYTVKNCYINPLTPALGRKNLTTISIPTYNTGFNSFTFVRDRDIQISAGIMLRNTAPLDVNGQNAPIPGTGRTRDTLRNLNNVFDGNVISNFGYGIASVGAGPLYRVGNPVDRLYEEYNNGNNRYSNNMINDVGRAGIAVAYEQNSTISNNAIRRVDNTSTTVPHAAGIWLSNGGYAGIDTVKNRGYSTGIIVERNSVGGVTAGTGDGAGILARTSENVFISQTRVYRFPSNAAVNNRYWNNMIWNFTGQAATFGPGVSVGVGIGVSEGVRPDFIPTGNRIESNTIFNQIAGSNPEYGIGVLRNTAVVQNNIIAMVTPTTGPIGLAASVPNYRQTLTVNYNLYWVPFGAVGALANLSTTGFNIPSPPVMQTLNQWRTLTGLDSLSISGNIMPEFYNTTPGSENLHIIPTIVGALANNRGTPVAGLTTDIDGDPRAAGGNLNRPDIGADEFSGSLRNNDLLAQDILSPFGYRAITGQYSDAEYQMIDSMIPVNARFANVGGLPQTLNTVTLNVEYWTGASWSSAQPSVTRSTTFNVAQSKDINFGNFAPRSLSQMGIADAYYNSMRYNVSPLYRFRVTTGVDDYTGNNTYEKIVRFYLRRSSRHAMVAVKQYTPIMPVSAVDKSNKLNTDTLLAALDSINWERADGVGVEDFDLFERDRWPKENLNFNPWVKIIWSQGEEATGLVPEERAALKRMLDSRSMWERSNLVIAGQEVARIHDVALNATNGQTSDQDFTRNYLRGEYRSNTTPADYNGRTIRGVAVTPGKYETIRITGVVGDFLPNPSLLRVTNGEGIARASHNYTQQSIITVDSAAGVATASQARNVIYYAIDWRHYGRFQFEPDRSGAQRLLLSAIDFFDQYWGVLPVKLLSFDAYQSGRGQKAVTVEWQTTEEVNVAGLEIERAIVERTDKGETIGEFRLVERRNSAGSAASGASYRVTDRNVEFGAEYRYRLVSVGLDGQRTVDASRNVKVLGGEESAGYNLSVVPNPAATSTTIAYRAPEGTRVRVELYDATGRLVRTLTDGFEASAAITLNVNDLASGLYTVRLQTSTGVTRVEKVTVQK